MRTCIIITLLCLPLFGRGQISGTLVDQFRAPVPYANVVLKQSQDSSFYKGVVTDLSGNFQISDVATGSYFITCSSIGFRKHQTEEFIFNAAQPVITFSEIVMSNETQVLEGVEVTAQKLKIEQKPEGMVLNVESSIMSKGSSALQLIERSPGVVLDQRNNTLTLNGQDGTLIMINGRAIRMSTSEITNLLRGMSADNIEKIELLTNPSSKYDADGGAGIINLIMKKDETLGTNGSVSLGAGLGSGQKEAVSFSLNHRSSKTNYFGSYAFNYDDSHYRWHGSGSNSIPVFDGTTFYNFFNRTDQKTTSHNFQLGIEQDLSDNFLFGLNGFYNQSNNKTNVINTNDYLFAADPFVHTRINIIGTNRWRTLNTSAFIEKSFANQSRLKIDGEYLYFINDFPTTIQNDYFDENNESISPTNEIFVPSNRGESNTNINIGVLKADFESDLNAKVRIESGLKGTYSITENDARIDQLINEEWVVDGRNESTSEITEFISAAYTSFHIRLDSNTTLNTGLRYEHWSRDFKSTGLKQRSGKLFPTLFASRTLNKNVSLQFAYNRRISRPSYNDLAANLTYNSPTAVFGGNQLLRATITDNFRFGVQLKDINLAMVYTHETDPIVRFQVDRRVDSDLIVISPQNLAYQTFLGVQTNMPFEVNDWLSFMIGGSYGLRRFKLTHTPQEVADSYFALNTYGSGTIQLSLGFIAEVSGFYNGNNYYGSLKGKGFGQINFGIKKDLKNNRGSLQFAINDVFESMGYFNEIGVLTPEHYEGRFDVAFTPESGDNRIYRLTYIKSFGSNKVKTRKRTGASSESNRVNKG